MTFPRITMFQGCLFIFLEFFSIIFSFVFMIPPPHYSFHIYLPLHIILTIKIAPKSSFITNLFYFVVFIFYLVHRSNNAVLTSRSLYFLLTSPYPLTILVSLVPWTSTCIRYYTFGVSNSLLSSASSQCPIIQ